MSHSKIFILLKAAKFSCCIRPKTNHESQFKYFLNDTNLSHSKLLVRLGQLAKTVIIVTKKK